MEFVIEYREVSFGVGMWHADSNFSDITLAEKIYKKNIEEMPEYEWRLFLLIKDHESQISY